MKTQNLEKANRILKTNFNNWEDLCKKCKLNEEFIELFQNDLNWVCISIFHCCGCL